MKITTMLLKASGYIFLVFFQVSSITILNNFTKTLSLRAKVPNTYGTRLYILYAVFGQFNNAVLEIPTSYMHILNHCTRWRDGFDQPLFTVKKDLKHG